MLKIVILFQVLFLFSCAVPRKSLDRQPASDAIAALDPKTAERLGDMLSTVVIARHGTEEAGVTRTTFLKQHGCLRGEMTIVDTLPEAFAKGIFSGPGTKKIWVRFSSDADANMADSKNKPLGMAVKVIESSQDFLLQNHPTYFVDNANDYLAYSEAAFRGKEADYFREHQGSAEIYKSMNKPVDNVLSSTYWSAVPYKFGESSFAKYKVVPCEATVFEGYESDDANYLQSRLRRDMKKPACFKLQVQLRANNEMPLDQATVEWSEQQSIPETVAILKFSPQDPVRQAKICENLIFSPFHSSEDLRPVGTLNEARGLIYKRLADERRLRNRPPKVKK